MSQLLLKHPFVNAAHDTRANSTIFSSFLDKHFLPDLLIMGISVQHHRGVCKAKQHLLVGSVHLSFFLWQHGRAKYLNKRRICTESSCEGFNNTHHIVSFQLRYTQRVCKERAKCAHEDVPILAVLRLGGFAIYNIT